MGYLGLTNANPFWVPEAIRQRANVSRLFYYETNALPVYEIWYQTRHADKPARLDEADFFRMRPFGYRTRLQRLLSKSDPPKREALAGWIQKKSSEKNPRDPVIQITIIRFPSLKPKSGELTGHYRQIRSEEVAQDSIETLGTYDYAIP